MQAQNNAGRKKLRLSGSLICMLAAFVLIAVWEWLYYGFDFFCYFFYRFFYYFDGFMWLVCGFALVYLCFLYPKKKCGWCLPILLLLFFMMYFAYTGRFKLWMEYEEISSYYFSASYHKMVIFSTIKQALICIVGIVSIACSLLGFRRYRSVSTSKVFGGAAGLLVFYEFVLLVSKLTNGRGYSFNDCVFTVAVCLFLVSVFLLARKGECPILIKAVVTKAEPEPERKEIAKAPEISAEDQLLLLKAKLDAGMISEEEYQKQRLAVLQSL